MCGIGVDGDCCELCLVIFLYGVGACFGVGLGVDCGTGCCLFLFFLLRLCEEDEPPPDDCGL